VPIPRRPAQIRRQHRIYDAEPAERPADSIASASGHRERLGVLVRDPVVRADIDHDPAVVDQPGEEVRRVAPPTCPDLPIQPERLRRERRHLSAEVQPHRVVSLQPGLKPHMPV
jgi:hypothetical protein